jgi:hypothetical protein
MLRGPNRKVMGASVPEVDLGSPIDIDSLRSQRSTSSSVVLEAAGTMMLEK